MKGTLAARSVGDLFDEIHAQKLTGRLRFTRREGKIIKDVWFEFGEIVSSGTNDPREYLGQFLISAGKISERDFLRAYRTQVETKVLFGKVLAMFGLASEAEIAQALKGKTEETIWDVFLWPDGTYEFDDATPLRGERLPMRIELRDVVAEGERRVIQWGIIRQTFPDLEFEAEVMPPKPGAPPLSPRDESLLDQLVTGRTPAQAALELRLSPYQLLWRAHDLFRRGRLRVNRTAPPPDTLPPGPAPQPVELEEVETVDPGQRFTVGKGETLAPDELRARIPVLAGVKSELMKGSFTAEEGYLLSRIDGVYDVATVVSLCPFREVVALERLADLAVRGVVTLQKA